MLSIPSPLHPAVVHFPIVLLLIGSLVAVAAVFIRRWNLPALAAVLLILGAGGTVVSVATGDREGELVGERTGSLLDEHEDWAERTRTVSLVAAALATVAVVVGGRRPLVARGTATAAAIAALSAAWCVAETGHRGGALVYRHGAGVMSASTPATSDTVPKGATHAKEVDDD